MFEVTVERRVTDLEELVARVWRTIEESQRNIEWNFDRVDRQIERTQRQVDQTSREMREFKEEMGAFKGEMGAFKDEMREFKDEMREFKDEMLAFREEERESRREMNKKWGELANKMGTMAEDLVAPSVPRILRQTVGCPDDRVDRVAVRVRIVHPVDRARKREFDVMAVCGQHVLINETKSSLNVQAVEDFARRLPQAREFLSEYADKKFIGAIASLYVDESVVRYGERQGLIVLGFGEDVMEVLNSPGFVPTKF